MAYPDLDTNLGKESKAMLKEVKKFTMDVMRPVGMELDKLSDPEEVIGKSSPLWEIFKTYHELDLHLLSIPDAMGGMEEDIEPLTSILITEQMGYADAGLAISLEASTMPFRYASKFQVPELQQMAFDYCQGQACEMIGCWAISEPGAGRSVKAFLKGDEYILNGELGRVSNGTIATHAAFSIHIDSSGSTKDESGLAIIPLSLPGISKGTALKKMGQRPLNHGSIIFNDAKIPKEYVVANHPAVTSDINKLFVAGANGSMGVLFAGLAKAAYDEAFNYSKDRIQGGVPIFEHKNIKLQLFKMFTMVEAARANARRVSIFNAGNPHAPSCAHAVAAKCMSSETATLTADQAIQIFGGNGLAKEYPLEKIFRDARASMVEEGVNETICLEAVNHL